MNILSPIDRLSEVDALIDAGADELYGGYISGRWLKKYSVLGSANQRYFASAQIASEDELTALVGAAHGRGVEFYLTLNAPFYLEAQYEDILDEAGRYAEVGVDAFIVADFGLILRLRKDIPHTPIHLSTLGTAFNSRGAEFFSRLGVRRIVFPRELTTVEMAGIAKANPGVSFDAFIMIGKCPNIEGFCNFTHNNPSLIWPCEELYHMDVLKDGGQAGEIISAQAGWSRVNRRQACGLCAIPRLEKAGVTALKLVGRGGPTALKVKVIEAVRRILNFSGQGMDDRGVQQAARGVYSEVFGHPCSPYICYFPEVW